MNPSLIHNRVLYFLFAAIFMGCVAIAVYTGLYVFAILPFGLLLFYSGWVNPRITFLLLLLSIPFSFEIQFGDQLGTDVPDELLMILVSFLFFADVLYRPESVRRGISHPLLLLLAAWLVWMVLSMVFSTNPLISLKFLLAKSWYIGAFVLAPLVVLQTRSSIRAAALMLATGMMIVVVITLVRHARMGFTFATINDAVFPFFRNHVNYGALLVCMIPVLAAGYFDWRNPSGKKFMILLLIIALAALFFSYSRGAWLALLAGGATVWLIRRRLLVTSFAILLAVTIGVLSWLKKDDRYLLYAHDYQSTIFHKDFNEHLVATYKLKDVSTAERFYRWIAAVNMVGDNKITGFGPGTFYENYKPYGIPAYRTWVSDNKDRSTVHNYFLLVAAEQGLPGLLIFLALVFAVLWYAQHLHRKCTDPFYRMVAMVTASIFVMILVLNSLSDLVETDKAGSIFFLCISVLVVTDRNNRMLSNASTNMQRIS